MLPRLHKTFRDGELIESTFIDVSWEEVRATRNSALIDSDWRAGKDVVLSTPWKDYRQALRDLPQVHDSANDAADAWPTPPE